ncbi:MAG: hypothetical protein A2070_05355 [Bdellovibrionales bacterium GWC1_52_8]|nr:MAG: hypothetical protein A2Z97_07180 [Bdellovibrionales bacterium GWB1_52_6]OFZ04291.1 MAG: hypothetical protein A2X97_06495 [Bdellovibrionales bacterium GWA1_52_35]OFZ35924.1 MAG: hypothetical protein A2070_05355 [Bdellovibrionales bacterium GWC1_52_8]
MAWLLLGVLSVSFWGCGKGNATQLPGPDENYRYEVPTQNEEEAQKLMPLSRANCVDLNDCPEAVGMLIVATPRALGMCTAFLVGSDQIMTNNHCIREFITERKSCSGLVEIIFPETAKKPAERAGCAQIHYSSDLERFENSATPDYALLRLARTVFRKPLQISNEGVSEGEALRVARMNPVATGSYSQGDLQMVSCEPVYKPWFLPQADNPFSPLLVFAGCEMVGAHAGSPMLDSDGRARAIVQARLPRTPEAAPASDLLEKPEALSISTNLSCMKTVDTDGSNLPRACSADLSQATTAALREKLIPAARTSGRAAVQAETRKWSENQKFFIEWIIRDGEVLSSGAQQLNIAPGCFQDPKSHGGWLNRYRGGLGGYKKEVYLQMEVPGWELQVGYNGRQQAIHRVQISDQRYPGLMSFSPQQLKREGKSKTRILIEGIGAAPPLLDRSAELPFCSP